jgi:hypothetical protein
MRRIKDKRKKKKEKGKRKKDKGGRGGDRVGGVVLFGGGKKLPGVRVNLLILLVCCGY